MQDWKGWCWRSPVAGGFGWCRALAAGRALSAALSRGQQGCGFREGGLPRGHSRVLHFPPTERFRKGAGWQEGGSGRSASPTRLTREGERKKPQRTNQNPPVFPLAEMWVSAFPPDRDSQIISVSVEQSCWPQACRDIFNKIKCRFFSPVSTCVSCCFPSQLPPQHTEAAPSPECSVTAAAHQLCTGEWQELRREWGTGDKHQQHCQDLRAALLCFSGCFLFLFPVPVLPISELGPFT